MKRTKEHQRVYSIPSCSNINNLSSHNILNSFLLSLPTHKTKKTPFISRYTFYLKLALNSEILSKFIEDLQNQKEEKTTNNNENQPQEKKKLHHQKSNSFNTKSLVIVETNSHEQKT